MWYVSKAGRVVVADAVLNDNDGAFNSIASSRTGTLCFSRLHTAVALALRPQFWNVRGACVQVEQCEQADMHQVRAQVQE
jgi:hypothetical protein